MTTVLRLPFALLLLFYQSIVLALSQIWANKVRGILTTLGILIGVAAVSAVIALIDGMKTRVLAEFESFGTNKLYIQPHWRKYDRTHGGRAAVVFKTTDFDHLLENCPSVVSFTREVGLGGGPVASGAHPVAEEVRYGGFDPEWHDIEHRGVT